MSPSPVLFYYVHLAEQITALFQFSLRGHQHASTYIRPVLSFSSLFWPIIPDRDLCPLKASFLRSPVPHWQSHGMFTTRTQPWCQTPPFPRLTFFPSSLVPPFVLFPCVPRQVTGNYVSFQTLIHTPAPVNLFTRQSIHPPEHNKD